MEMPRKARIKSESGIYHAILRGINQQQLFEDAEDCEKFIQVIKDCKAISEFEIYAYCLMGNHVHLLIKETKEPIEQIFKRIGSRYVYWYNTKYQRVGHLFQDRFKSEPVETEGYFLSAMRYIHQNPIKAGICEKIEDWKYSSFNEFYQESDLINRKYVFEIISIDEFYQFNCAENSDKCLEAESISKVRMTDEQAKTVIYKYSKCNSVADFQGLSEDKKHFYIVKFYENGISIRQIARLTGTSKGMVEKWIK